MPRSKWKTNLVNAFPIPEDRKPKKKTTLQAASDSPDNTPPEELGYQRPGTFPLLSLPAELRHKIYNLLLFNTPNPLTSSCDSHDRELLPTLKDLSILHLNKQLHLELTHLLYSTATFRLFPLQDFLGLPLLLDIAPHYRTHITRLTITLGSSWTPPGPPWRVTKGLARALGRMRGVRVLRVFVTLDPSEGMFERYRMGGRGWYADYCGGLLRDVLKAMPRGLEGVELDGAGCVLPDGVLVGRLREEVEAKGKRVVWGREGGWGKRMRRIEDGAGVVEAEAVGVEQLGDRMLAMELDWEERLGREEAKVIDT